MFVFPDNGRSRRKTKLSTLYLKRLLPRTKRDCELPKEQQWLRREVGRDSRKRRNKKCNKRVKRTCNERKRLKHGWRVCTEGERCVSGRRSFFFSLVHEPFALLVIGPNSLVKRDRGSMSRGPKSARTLVWCSSVRWTLLPTYTANMMKDCHLLCSQNRTEYECTRLFFSRHENQLLEVLLML